ncbi:hypothetical protein [Desulfallas thermosapovorans]|uniref:hypothetical protein n=1 Tax=Desulfallas thermosapovorans TaxID=58137 RepID=UPI001412DADD|nr:hypothetical protein [Desulfallas thermosapovorans]
MPPAQYPTIPVGGWLLEELAVARAAGEVCTRREAEEWLRERYRRGGPGQG